MMKYAVLESGGKQYIAREGETLQVDRLPDDVGSKIRWDDVLLVVDDSEVSVGTPKVKGAKVQGTLIEQIKAPKILVFKYKSRERYRRRIGHRQRYSRVLIENISVTKPRTKKAETETKASEAEVEGRKKATPKKATQSKKAKASTEKKTETKKASGKGASAKGTSRKTSSGKGSTGKTATKKSASSKRTSTKKKESKE
jgi:large subunit ribosomal protein L21